MSRVSAVGGMGSCCEESQPELGEESKVSYGQSFKVKFYYLFVKVVYI